MSYNAMRYKSIRFTYL